MGDLDLRNLKMEFKHIENSQTVWDPDGIKGCNEESFVKNNPLADKSIFKALDTNNDGYISEWEYNLAVGMAGEDGILTDKERNDSCMEQMKFFAKRGIDKWFKIDKNRDGFANNIEMGAWKTYNKNGKTLEGSMSNDELAHKYRDETQARDIQAWLDDEVEELKQDAKTMYGVELSQKQIIEIKKEQMKQLNTWLLKEGDNEKSSGYQQLNLDAYTRLMSTHDREACCGGDIGCELPLFSPSNLDKNDKYTADEMKARLNWAENSHLVDDNGKTVYDANGQTIPAKLMTPEQVQMYKDIVESVTGQAWDSEGWEVTIDQWHEIGEKLNGTYGDDTRLEGKTRADIPENRQALLRFLEEKGWLYEQFK